MATLWQILVTTRRGWRMNDVIPCAAKTNNDTIIIDGCRYRTIIYINIYDKTVFIDGPYGSSNAALL